MPFNILNEINIAPKDIGQIVTSKQGCITIFNLIGEPIARVVPEDEQHLTDVKLGIRRELENSNPDPRGFMNTANDDVIRTSIIGYVVHDEFRGITIYDKQNNLIHWHEETTNDAAADIIGQIEVFKRESDNESYRYIQADDPDLLCIHWNIQFYGIGSEGDNVDTFTCAMKKTIERNPVQGYAFLFFNIST